MLLALVEHRPIALDYGRHPRARRAATGLVMLFCASGLILMFGLVAIALWAALSHVGKP
jgi:hypothetical protein